MRSGTSSQCPVPIALFIFKRPEHTRRVFDLIRRKRPTEFFVVADGPRPAHKDDIENCERTREVVHAVDWPCRVYTNFSEVNLGCGRRVSSGLNWVFDMVEEAIVLEDDCLPSSSFFRFCEEMLEKYRSDSRIGIVSGNNFVAEQITCPHSYYFSRFVHMWGWATWRRVWRLYDFAMSQLGTTRAANALTIACQDSRARAYWRGLFEDVASGQIDTWDYQVAFMCFINDLINIHPAANLVTNIGFGDGATHTSSPTPVDASLDVHELAFPLKHPDTIAPWEAADRMNERQTLAEMRIRGLPPLIDWVRTHETLAPALKPLVPNAIRKLLWRL
jgi:hypothetical protein